MTTPYPAGQIPAGHHLSNCPASAVPLASVPAGGLVVSGDILLLGFAVRETSGAAPATLDFFDGGTGNGLNLGSYGMAASGAQHEWFGPQGLRVTSSLAIVVGGALTGAIFFIDLTRR